MGVDVAAAGQRLTDQGVCFVVRAGVAGVDADVSGQGGGGVERGDADRVADQLGLYVQDLLAGGDCALAPGVRGRSRSGLSAIRRLPAVLTECGASISTASTASTAQRGPW